MQSEIKNILSLVIPCYNEEQMLPIFYQATKDLSTTLSNTEIEFIFINDGSKDNTLNIIKNLQQKDSRIHYISFSRNFGKESALYAGLVKSIGNYIAVLDADLQDPPTLIPKMLEYLQSGEYDCAATRRKTRKGEPPIRSFFAKCFYKIMGFFSDVEILDGARDFRVMSRQYVDAILKLGEINRFSKGIFPWVGFKVKYFEYENIERVAGQTKWSFGKLFLYSIDGIIAFSTKPLAFASILGFLLSLSAIIMTIFIVIRKLIFGDPVAGWASLMCVILFCSGLLLLSIGIVAQYIAKIYLEIKKRPIYIVKEEK